MFTNDIYVSIRNSLLSDGYRNIREVPVAVIEEKIKEYLKQKLFIVGDADIKTLLEELERCYILEAEKEKGMGNISFYLLWYMAMLQQFEIIWQIEEGPMHLEESKLYPGKIDKLVTGKNIDYIAVTLFLLEEASKLKERVEGRK